MDSIRSNITATSFPNVASAGAAANPAASSTASDVCEDSVVVSSPSMPEDSDVNVANEASPELLTSTVATISHSLPTIAGIDLNHIAQAAAGPSSGIDKTVDVCQALAEELGLSSGCGVVGGSIGYGVLGFGTTAIAAVKLRSGVKSHDPEKVVDGAGNLAGATSNTAAAVAIATKSASGALGVVGQAARALVVPLGAAAGFVEAGLGTKQLVDGVKTKNKHEIAEGVLGAAYGLAMAASAIGGGIPALVIAGAMYVAQFGVKIHAKHQEHVAQREAAAQQTAQAPVTADESANTPQVHTTETEN